MNNPAAQTALGPMVIVAAEQHESSTADLRSVGLSGCFPLAVASPRRPREAPGAAGDDRRAGEMVCGRLGEFVVPQALHRRPTNITPWSKGIDTVVILGAGYDTRAYRMPELAGIAVCEVDLPTNTVE